MTEAMIFDACARRVAKAKKERVATQRQAVNLMGGLGFNRKTAAAAARNLIPARWNDIVLGCVTPVGGSGRRYRQTRPWCSWDDRVAGVQINRFCASGLKQSIWVR